MKTTEAQGGILSGASIEQAIDAGDIAITPFEKKLINPASIDLRLGSGVAVYSADSEDRSVGGSHISVLPSEQLVIDCRRRMSIVRWKFDDRGLLLEPGVLYLMHTLERVRTCRYVPVLDGKSSVGRLGVVIHLTAGYGDPGFDGQYTLEVTAVHRTLVYPGMRFCQMRFHTLVGDFVDYAKKGHYTGAAAEGPVPSMLYKQFEE